MELVIVKLVAYCFDKLTFSLITYCYTIFLKCKKILKYIQQGFTVGPVLFNLFMIFLFFIDETEVCSLSDDSIIYSCSLSYKEANWKLSNETHVVWYWFRINSMVANPGKL